MTPRRQPEESHHDDSEPQSRGVCRDLHGSTTEDVERAHRRISWWIAISATLVIALGGFTWAAYSLGVRNETRLNAMDKQYSEIKTDIGAIRQSQERAIWILTGKRGAASGTVGNGG